ncbi:hypothetical protein ACTFIW_004547 [Dictyostelium discoideum]
MKNLNNILITGGAGFIGSHLSNFLAKKYLNSNIIVLDKINYCSNINNLENVKNIKFIKKLKKLKFYYKILILIQLSIVQRNHMLTNPKIFIENNILGTQSLLESCRGNVKIKKFIHVSTDEVYGCGKLMNNEVSVENKTILKPTNPYSASKASAEHFVECYHRSFNIPTVIIRMNNVYGPKQYHEKLIPKFINLLNNNEKCTIHGLGENKRNFIYIDDILSAFDIILNSNNSIVVGNTFNIGSDFEISILNVAKTLIKLNLNGKMLDTTIKYNNYIELINDRPYNDFSYNIDYSKIVNLGWKKKIDWETGIKLTYNWYLNNKNYWDKK